MPIKSKYAGFWLRLAAFFLDVLILSPILFVQSVSSLILPNYATSQNLDAVRLNLLINLFFIIIYFLYFASFESSKLQATPGKWAFGLKVVDKNGGRISLARATARHFLKYLSALPLYLGFVFIGTTKRKQGWHDFVALCFVLKERQSKIGLAFSFVRNFILARTLDGNGKINFVGYGAICTSIVVIISSFLFANSGYNNYSECILDKMPGTSNTQTAIAIRRACKELTQ